MGIVGSDVDYPNQLPTLLSLCTGYGGIERGLTLAGFEHRTVALLEIEAYAIANLLAKMDTDNRFPANLDLEQAYHQIKMTDKPRKYTTIVTKRKIYEYIVMFTHQVCTECILEKNEQDPKRT